MDERILRAKEITRTSVIGIVVNVMLVAFKAFVGLMAGSIAIILDAVNNLTDAISSIVTIIGIKLAGREPDEKHPFGHGRIEYFTAIIIAGMVLAAGVTSLIESVKKITSDDIPDYSILTLVIVAVAVVTKLLLGRFVKAKGIKLNSDALIASGADALFDSIISIATLIGAVITMTLGISVDGFLGAAIAIVIIKAGIEMLISPFSALVGNRADSEVTVGIKKAIASLDGVLGAYDLVLHDYGPSSAMGSVHVEISDTLTAREIHVLTKKIQKTVSEKYNVFLTVGIYAVDLSNGDYGHRQSEIKQFAVKYDGVIAAHGVFINQEEKYMSFDIVEDFHADSEAVRDQIAKDLEKKYPGFTIDINIDRNYSD